VTTTTQKPLVWLFGTGGTISQTGTPRLTFVEYGTGTYLSVDDNLARIPEYRDFLRVKTWHELYVHSGIRTPELLLLAKKVNEVLKDPEVSGVVVTHGTYSMEETAYWLHLTSKSDKPVVLTGTQRPPSALGTDSDTNLLDSLILAGHPDARGKGAMICFNNEINCAREVTKTNSHRLETYQSRELGLLGYVDSDLDRWKAVKFYRMSTRKHTYQTEFDVSNLTDLPRVDIIYAHQDGDGAMVEALVKAGAKGIVLAGGGAGGGTGPLGVGRRMGVGPEPEAPAVPPLAQAIKQGVVVVATNRNGAGQMIRSRQQKEHGVVAGDNLSPHKARILLRLALTKTKDAEEVQRMFDTY
jgi:L-asparaginase